MSADCKYTRTKLTRLEHTLASSVAPAADNSLETLRASMEKVITDMSSGTVQPTAVEETKALMGRLFSGLQVISQHAAANQHVSTHPSVLQMLQGQSPSASSAAASGGVHSGDALFRDPAVGGTSPTNPGGTQTLDADTGMTAA